MKVYNGVEIALLCLWGLRYKRVRGQEGVATPCCYSGANKGLTNTLLFSYYYYIRPFTECFLVMVTIPVTAIVFTIRKTGLIPNQYISTEMSSNQ